MGKTYLSYFNINPVVDILTTSDDSVSDVKKVQETYFLSLREWCVSHLINAALVESFGTSEHKPMPKNLEARSFIEKM